MVETLVVQHYWVDSTWRPLQHRASPYTSCWVSASTIIFIRGGNIFRNPPTTCLTGGTVLKKSQWVFLCGFSLYSTSWLAAATDCSIFLALKLITTQMYVHTKHENLSRTDAQKPSHSSASQVIKWVVKLYESRSSWTKLFRTSALTVSDVHSHVTGKLHTHI